MPSFKAPDHNERNALARAAREKALEKLRNKAPIDPAIVAERKAAQERREAAEAEKRAAKRAAMEAAKAEKAAAAEAARAEAEANKKPELTDEERKAIRDARYAARKARKGR